MLTTGHAVSVRELIALDVEMFGRLAATARYGMYGGVAIALALILLSAGPSAAPDEPLARPLYILWLLGIAANCIPLLFLADAMPRSSAQGDVERSPRNLALGALILLPVVVVALTLFQGPTGSSSRSRRERSGRGVPDR